MTTTWPESVITRLMSCSISRIDRSPDPTASSAGSRAGLPCDRMAHTATLVDFRRLAGKCCLILGGRQSAFEWAALMIEDGVESIDLVFRHDTPRFGLVVHRRDEGWFRRLDPSEREAIHKRFWSMGRLQLEPWLWPRVNKKNLRLWPNSRTAEWRTTSRGTIEARLDRGKLALGRPRPLRRWLPRESVSSSVTNGML
jgi:hypothetical protein